MHFGPHGFGDSEKVYAVAGTIVRMFDGSRSSQMCSCQSVSLDGRNSGHTGCAGMMRCRLLPPLGHQDQIDWRSPLV